MDAIYRAQHVRLLYIICLLFHRGQSLQQLLPLRQQPLLLLVRQVMRVPGIQRGDMGAPGGAEGSHGTREEGPDDGGWRSDGCGVVVDRVGGFCGDPFAL